MTFSAEDGAITTTGAGNEPNWLHTEREYENFRLTFEYKLGQWAEAAVYLRAPREGRPAKSGLSIMLSHDYHKGVVDSYITGALQGVYPPRSPLPESWNQWHKVAIDLDGDHLVASIDGIIEQDVHLDSDNDLRWRLKRGFIGFPDMGYRYWIRNIQIEDRGFTAKMIDLFDGSSLKGWDVRPMGDHLQGEWWASDGAIHGANGHSNLYAPGVFRDFELTALVRTHNRVNSGIFLRGSANDREYRGFEVQIYSPVDAVYPTGSVYAKQRSNITADYEEKWFLMQIIVRGTMCLVRIDGTAVAEFDHLPPEDQKAGRIGFQIHIENASVDFRDIRVREL